MLPAVDTVRLVEHVHGHVGWLAAASLVHPAILLRDRRRRADLSAIASTVIVTLAGAVGAWLYVPYNRDLKQAIFLRMPVVGVTFERKEHLAFAAIVLAWTGLVAYVAARRTAEGELRTTLRTLSFRAYVAAAVLATVVAALGTWVAAYKTF